MLAIPVKFNTLSTPIAPLFGKSKWFALVDDTGAINFWRNDLMSGRDLVRFLQDKGVRTVLFQQMGGNPFMLLQRAGIACRYVGDGRVLLPELLTAYRAGNLLYVTVENMEEFVERSKRHGKQGHRGGHEEHHHHH